LFFLKIFPHAETVSVQAPLKSNAYDAWLKKVIAVASPAIFKVFGIVIFILSLPRALCQQSVRQTANAPNLSRNRRLAIAKDGMAAFVAIVVRITFDLNQKRRCFLT
jgi:hypothetical protein